MTSTTLRRPTPHPILRTELEQAAWNHGYRRANGVADGWLWFRSDEGVPGEVALACGAGDDGAPWFLAVEHAGVAQVLASEWPEAVAGPAPNPCKGAFAFARQEDMRRALSRAFHLARSLPTFPFTQFEAEVAGLGDTEVDRIVRQRVGQGFFRAALIDYWGGCPLTGVTDRALLRASHIVPWAECASDADRLDVFNGLLLCAHWDAAFDDGLVSFADDGTVLAKPDLSVAAVQTLGLATAPRLHLEAAHRAQLARHREKFGFV
ncbi:HNH endonuclease (plasmid) [Novosphingobium sp. BL-8H]|uniref:HNH endonuclease n=1 Tax=Novosphingobium sp. BL-8H TaxID=3127640 RepID=UPI003756C150